MTISQTVTKYRGVLRDLPGMVKSAHAEASSRYTAELKPIALEALLAIGGEENRALIERWVETFHARYGQLATNFLLSQLSDDSVERGAGVGAAQVEAWVRAGAEGNPEDNTEGKVFDGRDADVESVVRRMQGILIYEPDPKGSQVSAREKYLPLIEQFLKNHGQGSDWVRVYGPEIVLEAWSNHIRATYPETMAARVQHLVE